MPSHPFFTAVDQDTRARRVYEFGVNTRAWLVEYRARHPHAPVDEARMQKRHDRAAREEMEERARMRPAPGGVDPVVTLTSVVSLSLRVEENGRVGWKTSNDAHERV